MLILAGVSISIINRKNGLFENARNAKEKYRIAQGNEENMINQLSNFEATNVIYEDEQIEDSSRNSQPLVKSITATNYVKTYGFTGDKEEYQIFTAPEEGYYKVECWGAQGGQDTFDSYIGKGAYTKGVIKLQNEEKLYIYVGSSGKRYIKTLGYNGGGYSTEPYYNNNASGGGATDIRFTAGKWDSFDSLKTRLMVAGGGASACEAGNMKFCITFGGGLYSNSSTTGNGGTANGATQTTGYKFGIGQSNTRTGAGGGYYGGYSTWGTSSAGSSYISGHEGCNSISVDSTESKIIHTGEIIHYSNKYFLFTRMEAGNSLMPTHDGTGEMTGNSGDGYAKITKMSVVTE